MMDAEAFANAVAGRVAAVLSGRTSRTETYAIGRLPFAIHAPAGQPGDWIGRAFPGGEAGLRQPAHCLSIWDGIDRSELPPRAPWDPTEAEPLGVYAKRATDAVRCAIDIHTDSLMVCDFARGSSYVWFPRHCGAAALGEGVAVPHRAVLALQPGADADRPRRGGRDQRARRSARGRRRGRQVDDRVGVRARRI